MKVFVYTAKMFILTSDAGRYWVQHFYFSLSILLKWKQNVSVINLLHWHDFPRHVCVWLVYPNPPSPKKNPDASFHFHLVVSIYTFSFTCWAFNLVRHRFKYSHIRNFCPLISTMEVNRIMFGLLMALKKITFEIQWLWIIYRPPVNTSLAEYICMHGYHWE